MVRLVTQATGSKYPLVVKLGTITPQGADVYSYAPDEVRTCPNPTLPLANRLFPSHNLTTLGSPSMMPSMQSTHR
eukprot:1195737-Prorocentrum_minimum.AAC.10